MKSRILFLSMILAAPAIPFSPAGSAALPPNILFILCDDLGINDLHCYGRTDHRTPNLDRLASEGIRFTSAYCAQPICSPSRAAILTGKTPARLHLTTYLPGRPNCEAQKLLHPEMSMEVPLEEMMIPEYLKAAGYVSACIGKWHVGGEGFGPLEQGFDLYHPGRANTAPSDTEGGKGEYDLTVAAERFIEANRDRPFFVYLAHNSPHIPYTAQPKRIADNAGSYEPAYAGVIETLDDSVGRLLAKLDSLGLADRTLVVFTSDNGGLHVPEGPHQKVTHNTPYRAGKGFVYQGGLRIPLVVRWPGHVPASRIVDDAVVNTDWIPTLLEVSGQPVPQGLDGVSLAPLLAGRTPAPTRPLFWHFPHYNNQGGRPTGAMREGRWMFVEYYDEERTELYDLVSDVGERQNRAAQNSAQVTRMRSALDSWRRRTDAQRNTPNPDFDPEKFRELYVDVDPSRFEPARAGADEHERMQLWRKTMNAVVQPKAAVFMTPHQTLTASVPTAEAAVREAAASPPLPLATPESQGMSSDRLSRLHAEIERFVTEGKHAGAITLLARNGRIVDWRTFGKRDIEAGLPMGKDTICRIYSMSKIITSVAVLTLLEEARFRLDLGKGSGLGSVGQCGWTGMATTYGSLDPQEKTVALLFVQHLPYDEHKIFWRFSTLACAAIVD